MKICTHCKKRLLEMEFYKDKRKTDGLYVSCKKCTNRITEEYRNRTNYYNSLKRKVRELTHKAIKDGVLVRKNCELCNNTKVDAHHPDYSKPLQVMWLCKKHHYNIHHQTYAKTQT